MRIRLIDSFNEISKEEEEEEDNREVLQTTESVVEEEELIRALSLSFRRRPKSMDSNAS